MILSYLIFITELRGRNILAVCGGHIPSCFWQYMNGPVWLNSATSVMF
jgi:hypothetical protein